MKCVKLKCSLPIFALSENYSIEKPNMSLTPEIPNQRRGAFDVGLLDELRFFTEPCSEHVAKVK